MKSARIVVIGAGRIGIAVGSLFTKSQVQFWDKNPARVKNQKILSDLIPQSDIVFICVPSWAVRDVLVNIKKYLGKKTFVVTLTKGLEGPDGLTMDSVLSEFVAQDRFGILGGAMLAEEIGKKFPTVGVLASRSEKIYNLIRRNLEADFFHLGFTTDVKGAALAGVLKNVYSLGLGMADCLGYGHNIKGWLVTSMVSEMSMIAKTLGGKTETVLGPCGLGDLLATGFSEDSLHFRAGHQLAKFGSCSLESEGLNAIHPLWQKIKYRQNFLPVLRILNNIVSHKAKTKEIFSKFIATQPTQ